MIACLQGEFLHKSPETLIINVGGVGYEVYFSQANHVRLPDLGDEVFLHIYTVVREDALNLYGFIDREEKDMFCLLMGVSGVGPKLALNILSGISPSAISRAISTEDIARLTQLPGVGKKTAERLCLELKDKVQFVPESQALGATEGALDILDDQRFNDALSALINLGYPPVKAKEALRAVHHQVPEETYAVMSLEELLRHALRSLA